MTSPPAAVLEAFKRIAGRPEGALVREYLQSNLDQLHGYLEGQQDPTLLRQHQGSAQVLRKLIHNLNP